MFVSLWNNIFYYPSLNLVLVLYNLLWNNLGLAIIVIAIIFRLLLIPLVRRQTEMTRKMSSLKPQLDALKKKYANNNEKLSQEQIKLYKNVGYNPLGCLVTFVPQLLVLSVLIYVIRNVTAGNLQGIYPFVENWIANGSDLVINTKFLVWDLVKSYSQISAEFGRFATLSMLYLLLSFLVGISQYFTTRFTQMMQEPITPVPTTKKGKKNTADIMSPEEIQKKMNNSFMMILPISTVFIAISAPSALSLYWIVQSVMLIVQYLILDWDKSKKGVQNLVDILHDKEKKEKK